jgi:hypothetical protein
MTSNNLEVVQGKVFDIIGVADAVIAEMADKYLPLKINGIDDREGFKAVHAARMIVKDSRIKVEKKRKELKEDALRYGQAILDEEARKQKVIDDAKRAEELEKTRKEATAKARNESLLEIGYQYPFDDLGDMSDNGWIDLFNVHKKAWDEKKHAEWMAEQEEKAKREAEEKAAKELAAKIKEEKKAARAPDKTKILLIADTLDAIQTPDVKTDEGKAVALAIMMDIQALIKSIRERAGAL